MTSDLNICHGKVSHFVLFPLFEFFLVIKLRNFDSENYRNALIFCDKKMMSDLNTFCQTVFDLVQISLFLLSFNNKLGNNVIEIV